MCGANVSHQEENEELVLREVGVLPPVLRSPSSEPDAANTLVLQGTWKLQPVAGKDISSHFFRIALPMPANASAAKDRVTMMNQALLRLAREILAAR